QFQNCRFQFHDEPKTIVVFNRHDGLAIGMGGMGDGTEAPQGETTQNVILWALETLHHDMAMKRTLELESSKVVFRRIKFLLLQKSGIWVLNTRILGIAPDRS
ncbi:6221_t:CDS:2, partial [Gigaspora rosea]